ncbi:hypothetical protein [Halocola ammonii]
MKRKMIIALLLVAFPIVLIAQKTEEASIQEKKDEERTLLKNDIGVILNDYNRIGLSYRHWFGDKELKNFGFQTTITSSSNNQYDFDFNGEIGFLYSLHRSKYMSLFLYQANSFMYNEFSGTRNSGEPFLNIYRGFSNSIGIGIEVIALQRLSINLSGGYRFNTFKSSRDSGYGNSFGLEAELGLFYKF